MAEKRSTQSALQQFNERLTVVQSELYKRTSTPVDPEAEPFSNITYSADKWKLSTPTPERYVQRLPATDRPIQRPPTYDGMVPWNAYLAQFSIAAEINGWTDDEKR
jgi:hypothetical protein